MICPKIKFTVNVIPMYSKNTINGIITNAEISHLSKYTKYFFVKKSFINISKIYLKLNFNKKFKTILVVQKSVINSKKFSNHENLF